MPALFFALLCQLVCGFWTATQALAESCTLVDQRNFTSNGVIAMYPGQFTGQTFVAGFAGQLVGIEVAPRMDTLTPDDLVFLEVFDATNQSLGTVSRPAVNFPPGTGNVPEPLQEDVIGPAYFDVTSLGIVVEAGAELFFRMHHDEVGVCDLNTFFCIAGDVGHYCFDDFECAASMTLGFKSNDPYPSGTARYNGMDLVGDDFAFKTFIAIPCAEPTVTPTPTPTRTPVPPVCGNTVLEFAEECDDGNVVDGDGCSATCRLEPCVATPVPGCLVATQARFLASEKTAGEEKLRLQWKKIATGVAQGDFGDPVAGSTRVAICLYGDGGTLIRRYVVDRAGQFCGTKPCWSAKVINGYSYKDKTAASDGINKIAFNAGAWSKGKADATGANNAAKGQTALPTGVVTALSGNGNPTIQIVTSDGVCITATMTEVTKDDGVEFKARKK